MHTDLLFFHNRAIEEVYVSLALRMFSIALIGVFVPVYLLAAGFSFGAMLWFFIIYFAVWGAGVIPARLLTQRWGAPRTMIASLPLLILFFVLLAVPEFVLLAAVAGGLQGVLFWVAYNIDFALISDRAARGRETGFATSFMLLASVLGPVAGGIIITVAGFGAMFYVGALVAGAAALPLLAMKKPPRRATRPIRSIFRARRRRDALSFCACGMRAMSYGVFWPLVIFAIAETHLSLGIIGTLETLFAAFVSIAAGFIADGMSRTRIIRAGAVAEAATWLLKSAAVVLDSFVQLIGAAMAGGLSRGALDVAYEARMFDDSASDPAGYFVFREIMLVLGRLILLFLVLALIGQNLALVLALTAVATAVYGLAR